jgi:hypothetical protein
VAVNCGHFVSQLAADADRLSVQPGLDLLWLNVFRDAIVPEDQVHLRTRTVTL